MQKKVRSKRFSKEKRGKEERKMKGTRDWGSGLGHEWKTDVLI